MEKSAEGIVGGAPPKARTMTTRTDAITDSDPAAAKRTFDAMMTMRKIDIAAIEAARRS